MFIRHSGRTQIMLKTTFLPTFFVFDLDYAVGMWRQNLALENY